MPKLTNAIIEAAIDGFLAQKQKIDIQIAELRGMLSGSPAPAVSEEPAKPAKRKMSAAGRRAIAKAQRARWAAAKANTDSSAPKKVKRKLSAAGRANIVAALKKRWASKKAG